MRVLRVPCTDPAAAEAAAEHLRGQSVDVYGTDGRFLLIPAGGSALFVWNLAEELQQGVFGHDAELAAWASETLAAAGAR